MAEKQYFVVCSIGWMLHYNGNTRTDSIRGGGSWPDKDKHEVYNFARQGKFCYGYVQGGKYRCFNLSAIAGHEVDCEFLDGVRVIWVAPRVTGGIYIVGWYNNARVYRDYRKIRGREYSYSVRARYNDCVLLPDDERTFKVKRSSKESKGFLGRPRVWYGDYGSGAVKTHVTAILKYVERYRKSGERTSFREKVAVDSVQRAEVEKKSVAFVCKYYENLGYYVKSVEKECKGWDLEARLRKSGKHGNHVLHLEVKGLSGPQISVLITRNEYEKMMSEDNSCYRLCVVTYALKNPFLTIFAFDGDKWVSEVDSSIYLSIDEQISAVAYVRK